MGPEGALRTLVPRSLEAAGSVSSGNAKRKRAEIKRKEIEKGTQVAFGDHVWTVRDINHKKGTLTLVRKDEGKKSGEAVLKNINPFSVTVIKEEE